MISLSKTILGAAVMASALAGSFGAASATIACTGNICWHTQENYAYPRGSNVTVHPDDWSWGANDNFVWREHDGQGYWRGDAWREF
jgi:hypothetical protein